MDRKKHMLDAAVKVAVVLALASAAYFIIPMSQIMAHY